MSEPITMSAEREAEIRRMSLGQFTGIASGEVLAAMREAIGALDATREAHKRTQDELQNVREAFIACSETLYAEREQLRHSQEVSKALLEALKIVAPYHEDCYCDDDDGLTGRCLHCVIRAAIAHAERSDALRLAEVGAEQDKK